jgi:hypothetical protein
MEQQKRTHCDSNHQPLGQSALLDRATPVDYQDDFQMMHLKIFSSQTERFPKKKISTFQIKMNVDILSKVD